MVSEVDPAQHLPLIHRVIGQMHLYGDMKEEAFSEGLVIITEAAKEYDPGKGIPVANWLAKNIRWGLATWIAKQRYTAPLPSKEPALEGSEKALSGRVELASLLARMQQVLSQDERLVLLYHAAGYKGIEIAKMSGMTPVQVSLLKTEAQRKLRKHEGLS